MTTPIFNLNRKTKVQAIRVAADNKWTDTLIIHVVGDRVTGYPLSQLAMLHMTSGGDIDRTIDEMNAFMNERVESLGMGLEEITVSAQEADKDETFKKAVENGEVTIEDYTFEDFLVTITKTIFNM